MEDKKNDFEGGKHDEDEQNSLDTPNMTDLNDPTISLPPSSDNHNSNRTSSIAIPDLLTRPNMPMRTFTTTDVDTNPVLSDMTIPTKLDDLDMESVLDIATNTTNDHATSVHDVYDNDGKDSRTHLREESIMLNNRESLDRSAIETKVPNTITLVNNTEQGNISESQLQNSESSNSGLHSKSSTVKFQDPNNDPRNIHRDSSSEVNIIRSHTPPISDSASTMASRHRFPIRSNSMKKNRSSIYASKSTVTAIPIRNTNNYNQRLMDHDDRFSTRSISSSMTTSLSRSFLFGFYNAQRDKKHLKQKQLISKEYWMKDESAKECFTCGKPFTTFRRKHHCRICGQIFCHACTLLMNGERLGYNGKMRVCHNCFEHVNTYEDSSDEEDDLDPMTIDNKSDQITSPQRNILSKESPNKKTITNSENGDRNNHDSSSEEFSINLGNNSHTSIADSIGKRQKDIILLNKDDVRSIITANEDSKLFMMTPSPPPKMAIPATKQGESLEISFDSKKPEKHVKQHGLNTSSYKHINERYSLRDVDMPPKQHRNRRKKHQYSKSLDKYYSTSPSEGQHRRIPSMNSLRKSLLNYVGSSTMGHSILNGNNLETSNINISNNNSIASKVDGQRSTFQNANAVIGNLTNKNFKFQFNFGKDTSPLLKSPGSSRNHISEEDSDQSSDENNTEDEGTMSIYSSLNGMSKTSNPIRSTRNSSKSFQRAQASLKRIQNRRRNRSKSKTLTYKDIDQLTNSTPNLLSVVSDDDPDSNFMGFNDSDNVLDDNQLQSVESTAHIAKMPENNRMYPTLKYYTKGDGTNNSYQQWRRLSNISDFHHRRTSSATSGGKKNQLNEVAALHMNLLLKQVLSDQDIPGLDRWEQVFKNNILRMIQNTILSARDSNTLDYRQKYVKIKRLPGGTIEQSEYIDGIVFSKSLPSKLMPTKIDNPRILLIMFPLEYQKNENHFLSIEAVAAQEREYLKKLVSRLTSLHPDIIFVGANVSGYAVELLLNAGVTVQFNLKPQIIERISRLTEADIAVSIDKLASNVKMGECDLFEVKSYIYGNVCNTYTFLKGCNLELGGTILLRGDTGPNLEKIKHVAEFMVYAVFALELESSFFSDNFIQLSSSFYLEKSKTKRMTIYEGYFAEFLEKFNHRILTTSPTVEFSTPFLLTKVRDLEADIKEKQEQNELLEDKDISVDNPEIKGLGIESTLTFKDMRYITSFLRQKKIEDLQAKFKRKCKQWEVFYSSTHNMLGTGSHQAITVLYSMVSTKTATPCIGPQLVNIDYFWDTDISIGQLIENIVSTAYYPCEQGCNSYLFDHYRSYVHGTGKVDIITEKFQTKLPRLKNIILTWSYCKNCGTSTPILQISEKTWNYSFGKYLEIMFWSKKGSLSDIGNCTHDFTKDHVKYFSYGDLVVRMEYSDLEIHEVMTPPVRMRWEPSIDIKYKVENYYKILDRINTFYDSVMSRLDHVKIDSIHASQQVDAQYIIDQLKEKLYNEKKTSFDVLEHLYQEYPGDQHIQLNRLLKIVCDHASTWDNDFNNFEKQFLPSETDIARITSNQLKKLFKDTKPFEEKLNDIDENTECTDDATNTSNSEAQDVKKIDNKNTNAELDILNLTKKEEDHTSPKDNLHHSISNITIKGESDELGSSSSLESIRKATKSSLKVAELASFFDQIHLDTLSKDSELQKEFKRLRGSTNKYKNYRLQSSAPIIEVYKNVKDAVAEPLHNAGKSGQLIDSSKNLTERNNQLSINEDINSLEKETTSNLENELENSITKWGEDVWNKDSNKYQNNENAKESSPVKESNSSNTQDTKSVVVETIETQPEKSLLMKAITNFWADRSGYLWKPLVYPISPTDHVFADNDVIIREDEPSSLAAFCLNMTDYKERMSNVFQYYAQNNTQNPENASIITSEKRVSSTITDDLIPSIKPSEGISNGIDSSNNNPEILEKIMTKKTAVHLRYQFEDDPTVMSCKIFFSEHFDAFRKISNCNINYIQSLSRCIKWDSSGGKSGSFFLKTLDERFVIKELSHSELDAFIKFAPSYFEYMAQAIFHDLPTALAKIFGFYQIQVKNPNSSKSYKLDVIIMENLFYNNKPKRIFDLKGSMRNRHVEQTGKENEVLLDENMVEYIYESPIHVREYDKKLLRASLWNDTLFLAKMNVMDYSLVVGINNDNMVLSVGIIDFIRTFTWDKKLESWVKERSMAASGSNNIIKQPTVVTPRQYKNRFREAMERYILMVPDPWYQESI